jgi:hypothetical protein
MKKHKVYNLIILDESGSMHSIKDMIISGFNEVVQTVKSVAKQFPEQEHYISLISFNSLKLKTHHDCELFTQLDEINGTNYKPNSTTPLFDAMGYGINHLREKIKEENNCNVLVTILTDGLENASKEYDKMAIKALVEEMEEKKWTFTYIGTDHKVEEFATSIAIKNTINFKKSKGGLKQVFDQERHARYKYSENIRNNFSTKRGFYSDKDQ